jgi:molybdate transport system substrate-binding protein
VSYSTGPSGVYLEKLFERWGYLKPSATASWCRLPASRWDRSLQAGRRIDLATISELKNVPNVEVLGPLPPEIQSMTIFSGGISVSCADPAAARRLLEFMASPATATAKLRHGMEAAAARA